MYLTNEALGLMPVACPRAIDERGIELITREGQTPVQIDFVHQHRGMLIFGETRSGKEISRKELTVSFPRRRESRTVVSWYLVFPFLENA